MPRLPRAPAAATLRKFSVACRVVPHTASTKPCNHYGFATPLSGYAAIIMLDLAVSISTCGRTFRTIWRPDGSTCQGPKSCLAEFFVALNKDSDLYPGVQQGDNGQSLMLGGVTRDGSNAVNPLTRMVLRTACDVAMIDPKINLRISKDTDLELLALASELTRLGLGFPQYSNDDVVIPALVRQGYALDDARDYTVAACWEFIIPGRGMEIVNIGAVSMPAAVDRAIREGLAADDHLDGILARVRGELQEQGRRLVDSYRKLLLPPAPWYSVLMDGCLEQGRDLSAGLKYNNFGVHGAGSASAADALSAVDKFVFRDHSVDRQELLDALETDYQQREPLRRRIFEEGPKVGNNEDEADGMLARLFSMFADACEALGHNGRGGRIRPGSGSAMYYVWLATGHEDMREPAVGATADGRHRGEYFSANLAPSPRRQSPRPPQCSPKFRQA